jgi:hypothetical protein
MILRAFAILSVATAEYTLIRINSIKNQTDQTTICAAYNPQDYGFLSTNDPLYPTDPYHSDLTLYFNNFVPFGNSSLCKEHQGDNGTINTDDTVLVSRGVCTFQEKAESVKNKNGVGLITVNTDSTIFVPANSSNTTGDDESPENESSVNLKMFVGVISDSSYAKMAEMASKYGGWQEAKLRGALYIKKDTSFDPTLIPVWIIAISCIGIGTMISGYQALSNTKVTSVTDSENKLNDARVIIDTDSEASYTEAEFAFGAKNAAIWLLATSAWLTLLYLLYDYLVYFMIGIFCLFGSSAMITVIYNNFLIKLDCTHSIRCPKRHVPSWRCLDCIPHYLCRSGISVAVLILTIGCFGFSFTWFIFRHEPWAWFLQDVIGYFFCIFTISELHLPNFKLLTLILAGFCAYDVFMVYITPYITPNGDSVMVAVATGGDNPEKLPFLFLVPHLRADPIQELCNLGLGFSMLGFGDIIIPGFLGGYCVFFDLVNSHSHFYYWWTFMFSYGAGLIMTFVALMLMSTGQPALFFLVPSTLGSLFLLCYVRKETKHFWQGPKVKETTD